MIPDATIREMYALYQAGTPLAEIGRRLGRHGSTIRGLFKRQGWALRDHHAGKPRSRSGTFAPAEPLTDAQIEHLIATAKKIAVPPELKNEWRNWPLGRRAAFIHRLRLRLNPARSRPSGPFSANVIPFDYGTPAAWEIVHRLNAGTNSRSAKCKIDITSQGVIFHGELWFWSSHARYQRRGNFYRDPLGKVPLHHILWAEHNGRPVPPSHVVRHIDGNSNNLDPANLTLAHRNDLCRENQARALTAKSRAITSLLLRSTTNTKRKDHHVTLRLRALNRAAR